MLNEEQVIDVASEEVVETQPEQPSFQTYIDEYREYKRQQRKNKELRKQILNNQKALRGFGYTYKPVVFD